MSRRHLTITALVVVLTTVALGTAPAHAAKGMEVGLQDDAAFVAGIGLKRSKALKLADRLSVTRIRVNIAWAKVVNSPGKKKRPKHRHYNFTSYDVLFNAARHHGIKLQLTLTGEAPAWATKDHQVGGDRPNPKYWQEFVKAAARHFGKHVDRYTIWNEPNYKTWLGPLSEGPKLYHELYTRAYKVIRKRNPKAKIFIGETAPYAQSGRCTAPLKFLRKVLSYGPLRADGYTHHPYDFRHSVDYRYPGSDNVTMSGIGRLTNELDKLAKQKKLMTPRGRPLDVYLTEYGYMKSGKYKVSEDKRAKYLTKAFQMALDNPRVKQMTQYTLVRPPWHKEYFDTSIVARKTGKPTKTFKALEHWTHAAARKKKILVPRPPR